MTRLGHLAPPGTGINAKQISCSSRDPFLGWGDVGSLTNPDLDVQPEMCPHNNCMMYDARYHVEQLAKSDFINLNNLYKILWCAYVTCQREFKVHFQVCVGLRRKRLRTTKE